MRSDTMMEGMDWGAEALDEDWGDMAKGIETEPLEDRLRRREDSGQCWLWCLHCCRFFQAKDLRVDFLGNRQGCAFTDCDGAGFDVDIYHWDSWRDDDDPDWPGSEAELWHGLVAR